MKILLLFDGNALMYRAHYALPPLTRNGILVNATYGFLSALLSTINFHQPEYVVVTFDVKGKTFRDKLFEEYKAKRVKMPQSFYDQIPIAKDVLQAMKMPIMEKKGYEADDVIGTITNQLKIKNLKLKIIIISGDKDILQLIKSDQVVVANFKKGLKEAEIIDEKKFRQKYGFAPRQMIDYKALTGDQSDNIPGVAGIGEKTAQKLIREYQTIENIYKNISAIEAKSKPVAVKLQLQRQSAELSKKLATIDCQVGIDFAIAKAELHDFDRPAVEKKLLKLGFQSLIKRLPLSHRPIAENRKLF